MSKTKRDIFEAAIRIFSISGYDSATMDDIAQDAGVAKGTLYYHFKSKEELFKYIITEGMELISEELNEAALKESSSLDKLKSICNLQLKMISEKRDFFKVVMSQLWGQEVRQLELRDFIKKYISKIEIFLKQAMEDGVIKKEDSSFMAYTFFGTLCSTAVYELINDGKSNIDVITEKVMGYILHGIQS
ncbi:TetR/AcrR family transcriptional regulator [Candidatus Clostridium stratigraminis]|uniref:TetR/AcrR family transcriptional regulator n=1 Tax=Candidatus Clostridium stratigraminis TaxID=3381661 RepID=A0ABW8T9G8_9CLOT